MKKFLAIVFAFLLGLSATAALAACDSPFEEEGEVENKINIKIAILQSDNEMPTTRRLAAAFTEDHPEINFVITPITGDFDNSLLDMVTTPSLWPDILWVPGEYHSTFSSKGHFVNLKPLFEESGIDINNDFYPEIIATTHYDSTDDGIWFAPRDYNKPVIFYNKEMFEIAGISDEELDEYKEKGWDMSDFLGVCKRLRTKMDDPDNTMEERNAGMLTTSYPIDPDLLWGPSYRSFIAEYGGTLIDTTKSGTDAIAVATKASKDAYREIYEKIVKPRYCATTDTSSIFRNRAAAMWVTVRPELQAVVNLGIDVDFLPMPTSRVSIGCSGYAIPTVAQDRLDPLNGNTKTNAEWAFEFIKFILSEEGQELLGSTGTGIPVLKSLAQNGSWRSYPNAEANNDAFISFPDKDLSQTDFYIYPAEDHKAIRSELDSIPLTFMNPQTWVSTSEFETAIAKIETNLKNIVA